MLVQPADTVDNNADSCHIAPMGPACAQFYMLSLSKSTYFTLTDHYIFVAVCVTRDIWRWYTGLIC